MRKLRGDARQRRGRLINLRGIKLDFKGAPSVIRRLDDRIEIVTAVILIVAQLTPHGFSVYFEIAHDQRLEQQPERAQITQQQFGRDVQQRRRQRGIAETPFGLLLDSYRGTKKRRKRLRVAKKEQTIERTDRPPVFYSG